MTRPSLDAKIFADRRPAGPRRLGWGPLSGRGHTKFYELQRSPQRTARGHVYWRRAGFEADPLLVCAKPPENAAGPK